MTQPTVTSETPVTLIVQGIDTNDFATTLSAVFEVRDGFGYLGVPTVRGDTGPQGPPGVGIRVQGTIDNAAARPGGLNNTTDVGVAYFTADDWKLNVWTGGAGWITSGSLRGPTGPTAAISTASDFDGSVALTANAHMVYSGTKWYARAAKSQTFDRSADITNIPTDTITAIPWQSTDAPGSFTWSSSSNPSRIGFTSSGFVTVSATARWQNNQYNSRGIHLRKNGTEYWLGPQAGSAPRGNSPSALVGTTTAGNWRRIPVSSGDYLEAVVYQDSNGPLDALAAQHGLRMTVTLD